MDYTFGRDWLCGEDLDPYGRESTGISDVMWSVVRRVTTERGTLIDDPNYGIDIRNFQHKDLDASDLPRIASQVRFEVGKEPRVREPGCTVTIVGNRELRFDITFEVQEGEQSLTLIVNDVSFRVLHQ